MIWHNMRSRAVLVPYVRIATYAEYGASKEVGYYLTGLSSK